MRTPIIAGNWKMYKSVAETVRFLDQFKPLVRGVEHCEIVLAPPFPALLPAVETARRSNVMVAAQNLHWEESGAYTGEVSAPMLVAVGCTHVIVGHSERRQYFGETDETVHRKVRAALKARLLPVVCLGENFEQREAEMTEAVLDQQFEGAFAGLTAAEFSSIIVAYEPVWAIGTGQTATPRTAQAAHEFLRRKAAERFSEDSAAKLRILYGGSVKPANAAGLMEMPDIDGGLVGGASLDPDSFAAIVQYQAA